MELHNLKPAAGANHSRRRLGRGQGSGYGGTSTRGHKGAKARSGYKRKIGFEGGQLPLQRRLPKFGFHNINRKEYAPVNLAAIQQLVDEKNLEKVTIKDLVEASLVSAKSLVKVLGDGKLTAKVDVEANAFSKSAEAAITANGGQAVKL